MNMFNLATKITFLRILAAPILVLMLYFPNRLTCLAAMIVFILAAVTDMLDGIIARRRKEVSAFGKFLDPLADKILICSVLVMLVWLRNPDGTAWVPAWVTIVIICREMIVTGLRAMAADQGIVIAADRYGKIKTILQIIALCPLLLHYTWLGLDPRLFGTILLYVALLMTVFSGGNYLYTFFRDFSAQNK